MICAIVAVSANQVIGKDNQLPWRLSDDLKRFKALTMGHPLIMGRKTFESLPRVLPGRKHIVLTQAIRPPEESVVFVQSLEAAFQMCQGQDAFVIGGGQIYDLSFPKIERLYLTRIHKSYDGDAFFSAFSEKDFVLTYQEDHLDHEIPHTFFIFDRKPAT